MDAEKAGRVGEAKGATSLDPSTNIPHVPIIPPWPKYPTPLSLPPSQKELQQQLDAEKAGREDEAKGAASRQSEAEAKIAELERMKAEVEAARAALVRGGGEGEMGDGMGWEGEEGEAEAGIGELGRMKREMGAAGAELLRPGGEGIRGGTGKGSGVCGLRRREPQGEGGKGVEWGTQMGFGGRWREL